MSGVGGTAGTGAADAKLPTSFKVLQEVPLSHLPNDAKFVVQRQRGGSVPDSAVQFYLAWKWRSPDGKDVWRGGGSIQADQIQDMVNALVEAHKSETGEAVSLGPRRTGTFADLCGDGDEGEGG